MSENTGISLYNKLKANFITDFVIITVFVTSLFILNLVKAGIIFVTICMIVFLFVLIIKSVWMVVWIFFSSKKSLEKNIETTREAIMDMLDINTKQKELLVEFSKISENFKSFCYKLQNYSSATLSANSKVLEKAKNTIAVADDGYLSIQGSIDKMRSLHEKIGIIAKLIVDLSGHIEQISSTISIIENIAEQTNMLALNTAVEAARAGENGKGFAVVAGEIRKLADESKQTTHRIIYMINNIQQVANSTVVATEQGAEEIDNTVALTQKLEENSYNLKMAVKDILMNIENIAYNIDFQSSLPKEAESMIKKFEKNTLLTSEILDRTIECVKLIDSASDEFSNALIENGHS